MISQIDIRYSVSNTISDVKSLVNAFAGNLTLCLANETLYQYKEYAAAEDIPVADDIRIVQTTDTLLRSRWIAIDSYTGKGLKGNFILADWVFSVADNTYSYKVSFPNPVGGYIIKFVDSEKKEVMLEDVIEQSDSTKVAAVIGVVGATPDCRFAGSYFIYFDKVM